MDVKLQETTVRYDREFTYYILINIKLLYIYFSVIWLVIQRQ